jgi:hypothetical protein
MKHTFLILAALAGLYSCNNKSSETNGSSTKSEPPADGCYRYANDKDTVFMQIKVTGKDIDGKLVYQYFAKDKNTGTIKGELNGDTLYAQYTFMSEGKESIRSLVFLSKNGSFTEGYGKLNETTGEPDLSDKSAIHFDGKMILQKINCPETK